MIQFLSSRPTTPVPFRPKRSGTESLDVGPDLTHQKDKLNGAPPSQAPDAGGHIVANFESKVNGEKNA